jgi:hypothetical protein
MSVSYNAFIVINLNLHLADQTLESWIRAERWSLNPEITASNVYTISEDTNKKLVLAIIDLVEQLNATSADGR